MAWTEIQQTIYKSYVEGSVSVPANATAGYVVVIGSGGGADHLSKA